MLLYKHKFEGHIIHINKKYRLDVFKPTMFNLQGHSKFSLIYLMWYFFTMGGYKILYVFDGDKIIHYTHVVPKFWKFKFMEKNDFEIGPCWTDTEYRGQGIYPYVIQYVVSLLKGSCNSLYMLVDSNNMASIKGIEKSGFVKVSNVGKSKVLGVYKKIIAQ